MAPRSSDGQGAVALLQKLVSINSVFPHEQKLALFARDYLLRCGFSARLQEFSPGRHNVVAQKGPRRGSVLLTSHLDTVPPYNYGRRNPLALKEQGGKLRGLGAWDMKAGLALVLRCAGKCAPEGRGLRVVLTADEENISEGTWFAQKNGDFAGCSVAVCNEIPDAITPSRAGARPPLLLGRRGRCVYRFEVNGVGGHGAIGGGISAVALAMELARALESLPMPRGKMGACRLFVRKFSSESRSLSMPTEAVVEADVHYVPPYTKESFLAFLKAGLRKQGFSVPAGCSWSVAIPERKTPYLPAYGAGVTEPQVAKFLKAYRRHIGKPSVSYGMTVADENVISVEGMPVITMGPSGGEAHSCKEWLSKKDYLLLWEKMPKIVQDMLDG